MKNIEDKTILNDIITQMNNTLGTVREQTQLTTSIINSINASHKKIKPLRNPKLCNFPHSSRKDEFNYNEGLGTLSLQPQIDALNNFKQSCIKAIKTKFEAMGPETSKDIKLATGAVSTLQEVLEAAKCFTQIVKNVNNLINSYIQSIIKMTNSVINTINKLESEINSLKSIFITQCRASSLISVILLDQLEKTTDILLIASILSEIQNELNSTQLELDYLSNSKERVILTLETSLSLLKNRISNFVFYMGFKNALNTNAGNASTMYMVDDFLDDFELEEVQASSFNWSVTNNSALYEYNLYDELNIIPKLNDMFKNYKSKATEITPLIIESRSQAGYLIMPEMEESLISCGLDPLAKCNVGLVIELSINHGETVIRAVARGETLDEDDIVVKKQLGKFVTKGMDNIEYTTLTTVTPGSEWTVVTDLNTNIVNIGDRYTFNDPVTLEDWKFSYTSSDEVDYGVKYFPVLFEVTNKTHNTVTLRMLNDPDDFTYTDFTYSPYTSYDNSYYTLPSLDNTGKYTCVGKINGNYILADTSNNPIEIPINVDSQRTRFKTTADLPVNPNLDDGSALIWTNGTYTILKYNVYSFILKKYHSKTRILESPHAGEKIPCLNWSLSVYPIGEDDDVNKIRFSGQFPNDQIYNFFLKAHWGFVPDEISTVKKAYTTNKEKEKFVSSKFLHIEN